MRNNVTPTDIVFRFVERSEDFEFFLEILIRRVFRKRSECLKSLLLWRHTETINRFWERAGPRFSGLAVEGQTRRELAWRVRPSGLDFSRWPLPPVPDFMASGSNLKCITNRIRRWQSGFSDPAASD
jgi:hypothetical protein